MIILPCPAPTDSGFTPGVAVENYTTSHNLANPKLIR
jgi:hypothetical protein